MGVEDSAPCRCRPGACGLEDRRACCYTNDAMEKWWLLPVSRRTPLVFSEVLIYLSYAAMVPPRGIAPRSLAYRARALLLSYGGIEGMVARRGNAPRSSGFEPVVLLLNYRAMKNGTHTR